MPTIDVTGRMLGLPAGKLSATGEFARMVLAEIHAGVLTPGSVFVAPDFAARHGFPRGSVRGVRFLLDHHVLIRINYGANRYHYVMPEKVWT